jgi:hypothetical protein
MTNAKKIATAKIAASSTDYQLPPSLVAKIHEANALLAQRAAIASKVEISIADARAAEAPHNAALDGLAQADARLALSVSDSEHVENELAVEQAAALVSEKHLAMQRQQRTTEALCRMAAEVDGRIEEARVMIDLERNIFAGEATDRYCAELNEALKPLVSVLLRGNAIKGHLRAAGIVRFLSEIVVPDPQDAAGFLPLIDSSVAQIDGQRIALGSEWLQDPASIEIAEGMRPLAEVAGKLSVHKPFVHPDRRPAPYVVKSQLSGQRAAPAEISAR